MREISVIQAKRYGIYSCAPDTSLLDAARSMVREDISSLVVLEDDGSLAGIITRADMISAHQQNLEWRSRKVSEFMSREVVTVLPQDSLEDVARQLIDKHIHRVVVVDAKPGKPRPIGVLSDADLIYHMVNQVIE